MSLAKVSALTWLLPLAGLIILLYLLKMRRKDLRVPATFLWPNMTYEIRANSLFQRLRLSWLLFLQLLALLLIIMGLAQPQLREQGLAGQVTILVLDASASMKATDVTPSRFEQARAAARGIIDTVKAGDRVSIIEAGPTPRVMAPLSADVAKLRRALESIQVTDADANVGEALRLAASLASRQPNARILLFSDGVFPAVQNFAAGKAELVFHKLGKSGENTGIAALGVTEAAGGRQLYCGIKNYGIIASRGSVDLLADGKVFNSIRISVEPRATKGVTVEAPKNAKVIEAELDCQDALAADNHAVSITDPGATVRALLVGKGNLFLERALSLDARVVLDRTAELPPSELTASAAASKYDLIIFDGIPEQAVNAPAVLALGKAGPASPVIPSGVIRRPRLTTTEKHEVLGAVDLRRIYVDRMERSRPKASAEVLADTSEGPMVVVSTGRKRQLYLAFEPLDSDFPLQVSFPIFVANALDFLVPRGSGSGALSIPAGKAISLPVSDVGARLEMTDPGGEKSFIGTSGGSFIVRSATNVGRYEIVGPGRKTPLYVTFPSESESRIAPVDQVLVGGTPLAASNSVLRQADYWRPFLLLALLVLAGEWWLFTRRS